MARIAHDPDALKEDRALDRALPTWHHRERHSIHVNSSPEAALAALRAVRLVDLPLARRLFRLRGMRGAPAGTLLDAMRSEGFAELDENVFVLIGKPWTVRGGAAPKGADFAAFSEPGWAKMAMGMGAHAEGAGSRLETETRIFLTDAGSRRRFAAYWLGIRPFSGLIRRVWLQAAKRRADA